MTITKHINKSGSGDSITIQGAFDLCLNDGNDYDLIITDLETYREQAVLAARAAGGKVTLRALNFDRHARPIMTWDGSDGSILTLNANHLIKGIKFVYDENVQGLTFRRCIRSNLAGIESEVSHCQFWMGERYHFDVPPPTAEFGHVGYWAEGNTAVIKVWNCLFRGCAYAGIRYRPSAGNVIKIYHNDFVKCEEAIWSEVLVSGVQSIHDNIFDLDGTHSPDCWKFAAIYINRSATPTQFGGLDYNLYFNRAVGTRLPPQSTPTVLEAFSSQSVQKATRAALNASYPTQEVHGLDGDPLFVQYCKDYHLLETSPALRAASTLESVLDDNDGATRPSARAIGCFDPTGPLKSPNLHRDKLQNATLWYRLTRETAQPNGAASETPSISLEYVRVL